MGEAKRRAESGDQKTVDIPDYRTALVHVAATEAMVVQLAEALDTARQNARLARKLCELAKGRAPIEEIEAVHRESIERAARLAAEFRKSVTSESERVPSAT